MKYRSTVAAAAFLLCLGSAYFITTTLGIVTVRAEGNAVKGYFNSGEERDVPEIIAEDREGYLRIPVPENVTEGDISVSSDPLSRQVFIRIPGASEDYYKKNSFSGDMTGICDVRYGYADGVSTVELITDGICVPISEYSNNSLFIKAEPPDKVYDRIIAIDTGHGALDEGSVVYGIEEKSITGNVCHILYEKLKSMDTMVCISSPDPDKFTEEERAEILNELGADLLISIHTGADPDTRVTNGVSIEASSDMEGASSVLTGMLAEACEEKDLGVTVKRVPGITEYAEMPFIRLELGFITNKYEAEKMNSPEYQEKAADTIATFVDSAVMKRGDE